MTDEWVVFAMVNRGGSEVGGLLTYLRERVWLGLVLLALTVPVAAQPVSLSAAAEVVSHSAAVAIPVYPGVLLPQTAVALALARHPEIRGAEAMMARRQADLALAESARWPTVQCGVGPGYGSSYGGGGNTGAIRGSLGVDMPLWDFGATTGRIEAAKSLKAAAREGRADTAEKVAASTFGAYLEAAAAQARVAGAQETIAAVREVADRIGQRARAGLSNRSDVNAATIAVARAGVEAEQARTAAEAALSRLIQLIGVSPTQLAPLSDSYALVARGEAVAPDFEAAPAIQAARRALEAAEAQVTVAEAGRLPALSVGASRTFSTGAYSANDSTWIGLSLRGSFSLGGAERQRVEAARADRAAAEQDLQAKRLDARTGWLVAAREEEGARRRLDDLQGVATLWLATRDLYWQEYILDRRSLADVINAERELRAARTERIVAMGDAAGAAMKALVAQGGLVTLLQRQAERPAAEPPVVAPPVPAPAPVATPAAAPAAAPVAPAPAAVTVPAPVPVVAAPVTAAPVTPPVAAPAKAVTPPAAPVAAPSTPAAVQAVPPDPVAPAAVAPPARVWQIQLGFVSGDERARALWEALKTQPSLQGLEPEFARAGPFTRLLAGAFGSADEAGAVCAALNAPARDSCVVHALAR
jgi:adhesin transport system outer membrane protein